MLNGIIAGLIEKMFQRALVWVLKALKLNGKIKKEKAEVSNETEALKEAIKKADEYKANYEKKKQEGTLSASEIQNDGKLPEEIERDLRDAARRISHRLI